MNPNFFVCLLGRTWPLGKLGEHPVGGVVQGDSEHRCPLSLGSLLLSRVVLGSSHSPMPPLGSGSVHYCSLILGFIWVNAPRPAARPCLFLPLLQISGFWADAAWLLWLSQLVYPQRLEATLPSQPVSYSRRSSWSSPLCLTARKPCRA